MVSFEFPHNALNQDEVCEGLLCAPFVLLPPEESNQDAPSKCYTRMRSQTGYVDTYQYSPVTPPSAVNQKWSI